MPIFVRLLRMLAVATLVYALLVSTSGAGGIRDLAEGVMFEKARSS